jgi:hypothetical protein
MKNESTDEAGFDAALAHGLARMALGLNIGMHGYTRLPNLPEQFSDSIAVMEICSVIEGICHVPI